MGPFRWLGIKLGQQRWLERIAPRLVRADLRLSDATRGRVGLATIAGMPELHLTITLRSGLPRTVPLVCHPRPDGWLVAGANWGKDQHPSWVGQLASIQDYGGSAVVNFKGEVFQVTPVEQRGADRAEAWRQMVEVYPSYAVFQQRTRRQIRMFLLQR